MNVTFLAIFLVIVSGRSMTFLCYEKWLYIWSLILLASWSILYLNILKIAVLIFFCICHNLGLTRTLKLNVCSTQDFYKWGLICTIKFWKTVHVQTQSPFVAEPSGGFGRRFDSRVTCHLLFAVVPSASDILPECSLCSDRSLDIHILVAVAASYWDLKW